ncbi:M56 family metallopeptidase [Erythrobacter aureus]|uniref:M56 family metallopeptidase n=1 Tax=Erythrobacter aureus TaxID=2182384 RepID=UPI003A91B262
MTELIREYWDWFLFDTLMWTGALIGVALLLRRPVAKYLGAGAAYALWFLPLARLLFPPVTLPAWMKPSFLESAPAAEPVVTDLALAPAAESGFSYTDVMAPVTPATMESPVDFVVPLVILWLVGAAIFMGRRFWLYGELRRELLEDARPVGEVGNIRLVETTAISGPMAFGVIDKVVALPDGFMVSRERQVRDLAIAHELEHHYGHDILVNVLIQPLFAAHWFNPLGWMGWTAMRRDQEAACDARVVASRSRDERAAYAAIIADFARRPQIAPRPALAAPMACPVLGDKSIIHRLRSLPMTDHSRRRRVAARGAVAAAVLALPMTASICYVGVSPATAGDTPEPTEAVWALADTEQPVSVDRNVEHILKRAELAHLDVEAMTEMIEDRVERAETIRERAEESRERAEELREEHLADGRREWTEDRIRYAQDRKQWADGRVQWAESRAASAESQAKSARARAVAHAEWTNDLGETIGKSVAIGMANVPEVIEDCRYPDNPVTSIENDGRVTMYICDTAGDRLALKALRQARQGIETNSRLSDEMRQEILRDLDEEIREWKRTIRS